MTSVLMRDRRGGDTEKKATWRWRERLESHSHKPRDSWNKEAGLGKEGFSSGAFRGTVALPILISDLWPLEW